MHRRARSHSNRNEQEVCLQVENITKELEYKPVQKQRTSHVSQEQTPTAFLFQGWDKVWKGESTWTVLVLGWKLYLPCVHCIPTEAEKAGKKGLCWSRNSAQYLQGLLGTLLCSIKLMLQAGWWV